MRYGGVGFLTEETKFPDRTRRSHHELEVKPVDVLFLLGLISIVFIVGCYVVGSAVAGWVLAPMEQDEDDL